MKKFSCFLYSLLVMVSVFGANGLLLSDLANATDSICSSYQGRYFLGFKSWDSGLCHDSNSNVVMPEGSGDSDGMSKFIWTIILNVVYDLFAVVGIIALGFVIFNGYLFLTSGGDPGKAAKARQSLVSSIAGIAISLSATVLVNTFSDFIRPSTDANEVLSGALNLTYAVCGVIATAFIVYGGIMYTSSVGDPGKVRKARLILTYAIIGLIVVLAAAAITNFIMGAL